MLRQNTGSGIGLLGTFPDKSVGFSGEEQSAIAVSSIPKESMDEELASELGTSVFGSCGAIIGGSGIRLSPPKRGGAHFGGQAFP